MTCDLFIRSYWKDFEWLRLCLASVVKYCVGFRAVVLVVPRSSELRLTRLGLATPNLQIHVCRDYADDYLGQQVTKLRADLYADAGYFCHVDSDCVFCRRTTPEDLFIGGRPRVLMRPSSLLGRHYPWRAPTERFLGWPVDLDFMQHPPFLFPRGLYAELRNHAQSLHGMDIEHYLVQQPARGFSEYNTLAAFAYRHHREWFEWIDTSLQHPPDPPCRWYWSWGGIDPQTRAEIETLLS